MLLSVSLYCKRGYSDYSWTCPPALTGVTFTTVYLQGKESLSQGTHIQSLHSDTLPSSCINF